MKLFFWIQILLTIHQAWSGCRNENHFGVFFVFCDNISAFEDIPAHLYGSPKFYIFINNSTLQLAETTSLMGISKLKISSSVITKITPAFFENARTLNDFELENCKIQEIEAFPSHNLYDLKIRNSTFNTVPVDLLHKLTNLKVFVLQGTVIPNLEHFPNFFFKDLVIVYINLANSKISSFDQNTFKTMKALNTLELEENNLSELPSNLFEDLKSVETLNLNGNKITHFQEDSFTGLSSLKCLTISKNKLTAISRSWFEKLLALNELDLGFNDIKEFDLHLKNLTTLTLAHNQLDVISDNAFDGIPLLLNLDLSYNVIEIFLPQAFKGLNKLTYLNLEGNKIQQLDKSLLRFLPSLSTLVVGYNEFRRLSDIEFNSLKNLTHLNASFNDLKEFKADFKNVPLLLNLDLSHTNLGYIEASMFHDLKNLQVLNVSENCIKTLMPEVFLGLGSLRVLTIRNIGLIKLELGTFSKLQNLIDLDLGQNKLNELPLGIFDDFLLESLSVSANPISAISEDIYKKQVKLDTINLENTLIVSVNETDVIPNLRYLMLTGTIYEKRIVFRTKSRRFEKINNRYWDSWCPDYLIPCQTDTPIFT